MRETFIDWNPRGESLALVQTANTICREYEQQGYTLTLRQLYYQFVARDVIPNTMHSYKNLGGIIDKARLAGLLDWRYLEDRTRNAYSTDGFDTSPQAAIESTAGGYRRKLWATQSVQPQVWVEKEALAGVIQRAAREVGVTYFACRGYVSQSEMYNQGKRFARWAANGKQVVIIHLGDHDPSGIDMTRDILDRMALFGGYNAPSVRRIALNMDQVEEHNPPPNPAKMTDSRYESYMAEFGNESWELDALQPELLHRLIVDTVLEYRDEDLWQEALDREEEERQQLQQVADNWPIIAGIIEADAWTEIETDYNLEVR